jgi:ArsR family transcriptional regulator
MNDLISVFKALSDETRFKIFEMLKGGSLCACKILEKFNFTQPTLSYHMKTLTDCGIVECIKKGTWCHYNINKEKVNEIKKYLDTIR